MSERSRNREIVERMAHEVKQHYERLGKPMTSEAARSVVVSTARKRDAMKAAGDTKNKRKGVESGKRRERAEREQREASADRQRVAEKVRKGSIFIDLKKG